MITRIWAHDGWCYIPELKQRQKFFITDDPQVFRMEIESWTGIIPMSEHSEELKYCQISQTPLVWQEEAPWGSELYEESIPSMNIPCHSLLPLLLPQQQAQLS
jgi:hypothetical protein